MENCIIKFGFRQIFYENLSLRAQNLKKGKALCESFHVEDLEETQGLIRARVRRQTHINLPPYKILLTVNEARHITSAECNCLAGIGGKCKHIAAVIFAVNTEGASKTSERQQWGRPGGRGHYLKGKKFEEMFPPSPVDMVVGLLPKIEELESCALKQILAQEVRTEAEKCCTEVLNNILNKVINNASSRVYDVCVELFLTNQKSHYVNKSVRLGLDDYLSIVYIEKFIVTKEQVKTIFVNTILQGESHEWWKYRSGRITGSTAHQISNRKKSVADFGEIFLRKQTQMFQNESTKYGKKNEKVALMEYSELLGNEASVWPCGLLIHSLHHWLCASLDGIVVDAQNVPFKTLEIKCPIKCKDVGIINDDGTVNISYISVMDGTLSLKRSHQYYTQIQIGLFLTGLEVCDLYIFSPKQSVSIPVFRDTCFIDLTVNKLERFFFGVLLPVVAESTKK